MRQIQGQNSEGAKYILPLTRSSYSLSCSTTADLSVFGRDCDLNVCLWEHLYAQEVEIVLLVGSTRWCMFWVTCARIGLYRGLMSRLVVERGYRSYLIYTMKIFPIYIDG